MNFTPENISLKKAGRDSISLKLIGRISGSNKNKKQAPKSRITIEMTSKALEEENESVKNGKSIWPSDIEISSSGRLRNIEADPEVIEELENWAESKGMNCHDG